MKKVTLLLLVVSTFLLASCGSNKSETNDAGKDQTSTSSKAKTNNSTDGGKFKTSDGKTTLVFSTGEVKKGGFPGEKTAAGDYKQYMHFNVDSSMDCEMYGYIGESYGSLKEWSDSPDTTVKDLTIAEKALPCFYLLKDKDDREIAYHLYDEALEEKYAKEYEEDESLYIYMQPVPALNQLAEEMTELESSDAKDITKKTGEAEGYKYTYVTYHYDEDAADTTFYVIYELSDTVRFSYRIMETGADFDPLTEVENTAKNIKLDD